MPTAWSRSCDSDGKEDEDREVHDMVNVWDAGQAVYDGLRSLEWDRYLRSMWIICGELQEIYSERLSRFDRSLEQETLDLVRLVALGQEAPDVGVEAERLHGRWQAPVCSRGLYGGWREEFVAGLQ
jgi:hypothetical protein